MVALCNIFSMWTVIPFSAQIIQFLISVVLFRSFDQRYRCRFYLQHSNDINNAQYQNILKQKIHQQLFVLQSKNKIMQCPFSNVSADQCILRSESKIYPLYYFYVNSIKSRNVTPNMEYKKISVQTSKRQVQHPDGSNSNYNQDSLPPNTQSAEGNSKTICPSRKLKNFYIILQKWLERINKISSLPAEKLLKELKRIDKVYQCQILKEKKENTLRAPQGIDYMEIAQDSNIENVLDIHVIGTIWDGEPSLMVLVNDISWHLKYQQSNQLNLYKDNLMAMVSHDLKQPLNGIIYMSQVAKYQTQASQIYRYLEISEKVRPPLSMSPSALMLC